MKLDPSFPFTLLLFILYFLPMLIEFDTELNTDERKSSTVSR